MSNLVDHARRELELIGEDQETIDGMLRVVSAFAAMGHSGGSASIAIPMLNDLLQFKNLGPLTDNPEEWAFISGKEYGVSKDVWQNVRNSEAFSNDGGKTYCLNSEGYNDDGSPKVIHNSVPKKEFPTVKTINIDPPYLVN